MSLEQRFSTSIRSSKTRLEFRFATAEHWIAGHVTTIHNRLVDVLNSDFGTVLPAEEATVQSCHDTRGAPEPASFAQITAAEILFAIPIEDDCGAVGPRDPFVWVKKRPERVRIGLGCYEIVGNVYIAEEAKLEGFLLGLRDKFIPITEATIKRVDFPSPSEDQEVVLVNRERIIFLTPAQVSALPLGHTLSV